MSSSLYNLWGGRKGLLWHVLARVAIIAVACSADLCGSLPWIDHCFGHHICSFNAQFEHCRLPVLLWLPILPIQCLALPNPQRNWFMVVIKSGKFLRRVSFSVMAPVGDHLQGWFSLTGLPWNLPSMTGNFAY